MAKRKSKAKAKAQARPAVTAGEFKAGDRVRIARGDYGNSEGAVASAAGGQVTVHVHGRLTVSVPASDVVAL